MKLDGKRVIITGGSKGLGAAIGILFADEGATTSVIDLDGSGPQFFQADVTQPDSIRGAIDAAHAAMGGIDVVVASAGVSSLPRARFVRCWSWNQSTTTSCKTSTLGACSSPFSKLVDTWSPMEQRARWFHLHLSRRSEQPPGPMLYRRRRRGC